MFVLFLTGAGRVMGLHAAQLGHVATVGLHGSASTWVFNVARELMIDSFGEKAVLSLYADEIAQVPDDALLREGHLVIKSHHGSAELDAWLEAQQARIFLSVRDPRDASISMSQRFKAPLSDTIRWLTSDCNRMLCLASKNYPLLRYEDRFFEDKATVERLAHALGLRVAPATAETIFVRYRTEAIRSFAQNLTDLPPERLTMIGSFRMDRITQILSPHIGDCRSGKWRDLPSALQNELAHAFGPFLDRFGYR